MSAVIVAACATRREPQQPRVINFAPTAKSDTAARDRMRELLNNDRAAAGVPALALNMRTDSRAAAHALEMQANRTIGGTPVGVGAANRVSVVDAAPYVALQLMGRARDLDELHSRLMNDAAARGALLSGAMTHVGIGVVVDESVNLSDAFVTIILAREAAGLTTTPPGEPTKVPPKLLEGYRISGTTAIAPDEATWKKMPAGQKVVASFALCLDTAGIPTSIDLLKTTGFPAYDRKLEGEMRQWRYRPYEIDDKAVPVCTAVMFVYAR